MGKSKLVKQEIVEKAFEGVQGTFRLMSHQSRKGMTVRCIKGQGENADQFTEGSEYQVVAGKGDEFTDADGITAPIIWDEAGVIGDDGRPYRVILNEKNESVATGASSQFSIVDNDAYQESLKVE